MFSGNHKLICIFGVCTGGLVGLLLGLNFLAASGTPTSTGLVGLVSYAIVPVLYLLGALHIQIGFGILVIVCYCGLLGALASFGLIWLYFFTCHRLAQRIAGTSFEREDGE